MLQTACHTGRHLNISVARGGEHVTKQKRKQRDSPLKFAESHNQFPLLTMVTPVSRRDWLWGTTVRQSTTVKLNFYRIRTMTTVSSGFRCSLPFLVLFVASQALAKPGNNANTTPVSSSATKHCNNVYFYAGSDKKIETILQEMKKQLTQLQDDINILKGFKTTVKGKILLRFEICLFFKTFGISNHETRCLATTVKPETFGFMLDSYDRYFFVQRQLN